MRIIKQIEDKYLTPTLDLVEQVFTAHSDAEEGALVRSLVEEIRAKAKELEELTYAENFWSDQAKSTKIAKELADYKETVEGYDRLCARLEDAIMLAEMAIEENDEDSLPEVESELAEIMKMLARNKCDRALSDAKYATTRYTAEMALDFLEEEARRILGK